MRAVPPTLPSSASGTAGDLLGFVASVAGEGKLRVEESLGHGFVRLRVAEAERRQAKHDIRRVEDIVVEMLRNARDAGARHIYVASSREGVLRTITMLDDGQGVPLDMQERIFEPRVTSKLETMSMDRWGVHGRGMALYSIRENAESARVVASGEGLGTCLQVVTDCSMLPERADQSTLPALTRDESGEPALGSGPHNIARAVLDFALTCRGRIEVYLGSPSEIVSTLYADDPFGLSLRELLFDLDEQSVPVCSRLRAASDASSLAASACALGLVMSDRTALRILSGEIAPLSPALDSIMPHASAPAPIDLERDRRGLRLSPQDASAFSSELAAAFSSLGEKYYLRLVADPRVRVGNDRITVTFPIEKL